MTTFVSCFVEIYDIPFNSRTHEWRIANFLKIARTGIKICLYTCEKTRPIIAEIIQQSENENYPTHVKLMNPINNISFKDMFMYQYSMKYKDNRPENLNNSKDTAEFIALMHNKIEFMKDTIEQNPWNSTIFAWVDFNIAHVLHNDKKWMETIRQLGETIYIDKFLCIPGCWHKNTVNRLEEYILHSIHWRFCGGFFIGDKTSVLNFYDVSRKYYPIFMEKYQKLIWEVNYWTWLEEISDSGWSLTWYKADHNDSILDITADTFSKPVAPYSSKMKYEYPNIDKYLPTSASYLYYREQHILNTRYVNYWCYPSGAYLFYDEDGIIRNKNVFSLLDIELVPLTFQEMDSDIKMEGKEGKEGKEGNSAFSEGLEDIRLYEYKGTIRFIASTVGYGREGRIEMIQGVYNIASLKFENCKLIGSPYNEQMEKNWIPIVRGEEELFLYKWWPLEFGKVNEENNVLNIVETIHHSTPYFNRVRGSTLFSNHSICTNELIGLVHFSEEKWPRHYSHMLVILDKHTLRPVRYTEPFHFNNNSVEFCIGFTDIGGEYCFWISNFDREPERIKIKSENFSTWYDFIY